MTVTWTHDAASEGTTSNVIDATDELAFDVVWNFHSCFLTTAQANRASHSSYPNELETVDGTFSSGGSSYIVSSFLLFMNPDISDATFMGASSITYDGIYMPIEFTVTEGLPANADPLLTVDQFTVGWDSVNVYDYDVYFRGTSTEPTPMNFGIDNGASDYGGDLKASATDADTEATIEATQIGV